MTEHCRIEKLILTQIKTSDNPVHKTYIRRALDAEFEVSISYPIVVSFLDALCEDGYLTVSRPNYYQFVEHTEPAKTPVAV